MSISNSLVAREQAKFVESTDVPGVPGIIALNPDGSKIGNAPGVVSLASGTNILVTNLVSIASINGKVDINNITALLSLASIYGLVGITGTVNTAEQNLISLASGTKVLVNNLVSVASINGLVDVNKVNNVASIASIYGNVGIVGNVSLSGLVSLASGTNILVQNLVSIASINGLIDVNKVNNVASLASIYGLVGISGTPAVTQSGNWDIRSVLSIASIYGTVGFGGLISLASGTNVLATQSGTWTIQPGNTANTTPWLVTQSGGVISLASGTNVLTSFSGVISLASGTVVLVNNLVSVASINGKVDVNVLTNAASLASIYGKTDFTQSIGLVSNITTYPNFVDVINLGQYGAGAKGSLASGAMHPLQVDSSGNLFTNVFNLVSIASINGKIDVNNITALLSLASIYGNVGGYIGASLATTTVIGSLNSLASIYGIVGNAAGANFIGLATVVPGYQPVTSQYTSFSTLITTSGAASLFAPPNNQRWVVKDLIIGSAGTNVVNIQSGGSIALIPYISLATMGGYISNFGESGMRADAVNSAFVVNTKSTATLSIYVNVRFDPT